MNICRVIKKHKIEIITKYKLKRIGILVSYARGQEAKESDVDVLVEFQTPSFDNFMELSSYLKELLVKKIDLLTPEALSPYIRPSVEKEVIWCE